MPQIVAKEFQQKLREGFTLIVNQLDDVHGPITAVAEALEFQFQELTQINLYAAWGRSRGFKTHRDDHDVFILQVYGRKFWRIYGPSDHIAPSRDVNREDGPKPPKTVKWEGVLEDGDLLYIPKDWWHEVRPQGEASLHLTCGLRNRNGLDFLSWIREELKSNELYYCDLPRFADKGTQCRHVRALCDEIVRHLDDSVLERFFKAYDAKHSSRTHLSLPWGIVPEQLPDHDDFVVRFTPGRSATLAPADGKGCQVLLNGKTVRFPMTFGSMLRFVMSAGCQGCRASELYTAVSEELDHDSARRGIAELLLQGLIEVVES